MQRTDLPATLKHVLEDTAYVTIATVCPDGQPWNTPVVGRFDASLNLYWVSHKESRHSQNIALEPRIFVVIYNSQVPEGQGLGLYFQMTARMLNRKSDITEACHVYDPSFFLHDFKH